DQGVDAARGGAELLRAEVVRVLRVAAFPLAGGGGVGAVGVRGPAGGGLEVVGPDGLGPFGGGEGPDGVRAGVGVAVERDVADVRGGVAGAVVAGVERLPGGEGGRA